MLSGYKTYIVAVLMIILGGLKLAGVDMPGMEGTDGWKYILDGAGFFAVRLGLKSATEGTLK